MAVSKILIGESKLDEGLRVWGIHSVILEIFYRFEFFKIRS